ncbi:hypothetical protein [Mycobacterium intracellulare]|uniref:hypothetical protein n=1 Tax=Mycobacterium intracellulare TaxID=1767 RepID=UPI0012DB42A6|nr:hypothetical protein [Mycobacterium intracellulare]
MSGLDSVNGWDSVNVACRGWGDLPTDTGKAVWVGGDRPGKSQLGARNAIHTAQRTGQRSARSKNYRPKIGVAFVHIVIDDHSRITNDHYSAFRLRFTPAVPG